MKVRTYGTALFSFTDNPFIFTLFIFTYVHMETIGIIMVNTRIIDSTNILYCHGSMYRNVSMNIMAKENNAA